MLVTLEHSGTQEAVEASNELKDYIEDELSHKVEAVVGPQGNAIFAYLDKKHIFTGSVPLSPSDKATIHYILSRSV